MGLVFVHCVSLVNSFGLFFCRTRGGVDSTANCGASTMIGQILLLPTPCLFIRSSIIFFLFFFFLYAKRERGVCVHVCIILCVCSSSLRSQYLRPSPPFPFSDFPFFFLFVLLCCLICHSLSLFLSVHHDIKHRPAHSRSQLFSIILLPAISLFFFFFPFWYTYQKMYTYQKCVTLASACTGQRILFRHHIRIEIHIVLAFSKFIFIAYWVYGEYKGEISIRGERGRLIGSSRYYSVTDKKRLWVRGDTK